LIFSSLATILVIGLVSAVTAKTDRVKPESATTETVKKESKASAAKLPLTKMEAPAGKEYATFAPGCFWSMEAIFKQLKGVEKVETGYAGGKIADPGYEKVETGTTGHAETINILFDPATISYSELLTVLLTLRNPTTLNKQEPDVGPQYRSVIFAHSPEQQKAAQDTIAKFTQEHIWPNPIVTEVTKFSNFYRAEAYHLDYYRLHPNEPYCAKVIAPEIADFQKKFKSQLKSQ